MLYSFDIFDTIVTRKTATPEGIFALMQYHLQTDEIYKEISAEVRNRFYDLRVGAESLARSYYLRHNMEEITQLEIYKAMATTGYLGETSIDKLVRLENALEVQNIVGIAENIDKLKQLRECGAKVILIEDSYFDEKDIRAFLLSIDEIFNKIPIYVSSVWKKSKRTGALYDLIRYREKVKFDEWVHVGDNEIVDVEVPKWLGISASQFVFEPFWGVERKALETIPENAAMQMAIGTARNLRLCHREWGNPACVGASIGGAILFPYVSWILRRSQELGIHRLYFIARDGYILKQIADEIIEKHDLPIETHYIYGSRRTWRMPGYDGSEEQLKRLLSITRPWVSSKARVVGDIADVLEISLKEIKRFLPKSWPDLDWPMYTEAFSWLASYLAGQEKFREFLKKKNAKAREFAQEYFRQEIGIFRDDFAFVELVGTGFTSECMANIIHEAYGKSVRIFYYNLFGDGIEGKAIYYNFLPRHLPHSMLLEILCRAMHGQTVSYCLGHKKITFVTVNDEKEKNILREYGYNYYLDAVIEFVHAYLEYTRQYGLMSSDQMSEFYLDNIGTNPDENVLSFLADMPFEDTGYDTKIKKFAPRLSREDIRDLFLFYPDYSCYKGSDLEYSLLRCDTREREKVSWYQRKRGQIIKRFKRLWNRDLLPSQDVYSFCRYFPFYTVGKRVVIYGAGVFGKRIYQEAKKSGCEIVGWLDRDYKKLRKEDIPVTGDCDLVSQLDFDVIWIALLNPWLVKEIKRDLGERGVLESKIMYFGKWAL